MDDSCAVRRGKRVSNLGPNLKRLVERERALREPLLERFALQVLHDQEVEPVLVAHIEHGADMRMTKRGERLGFPFEPLSQVRIRGDILGKNLNRDRAVQPSVRGLIHLAHAAGAQRAGDFGTARCESQLVAASIRSYEALQLFEPQSNNIAGHTGLSAANAMLFMAFRELKRDVPGRSDGGPPSQSTGTSRFSSSCQFCTTIRFDAVPAPASTSALRMFRNRPSGAMSYGRGRSGTGVPGAVTPTFSRAVP